MWWLLHGRTRTKRVRGGETFSEHCPECKRRTTFHEVEVTTAAGAFFVDVTSAKDRAFACSDCGETFDLRDESSPATPDLGPPQPEPRDLLAVLEAEADRRAAADVARDRRVDDELAALKRKLGK